MQIFPNGALCPFTGCIIDRNSSHDDVVNYQVQYESKLVRISAGGNDEYWKQFEEKLLERRHLVKGLILNDKNLFKDKVIRTFEDFNRLINQFDIPRTPKEKFDYLFLHTYNQCVSSDKGEGFYDFQNEKNIFRLFFKNRAEYQIYNIALFDRNLVRKVATGICVLTFEGLEYAMSLSNGGKQSKYCFIAIWYNDNMENIRKSIKEVVRQRGFDPEIVDEKNHELDSDKTINEDIIARIKKSRFCIADLTGQRQNVYFEAGYAAGLGIPVIYCVKETDFGNLHFDFRQFPIISYTDTEDLKKQLKDRIEVKILD